jgi:predicted Zn-dependent protease
MVGNKICQRKGVKYRLHNRAARWVAVFLILGQLFLPVAGFGFTIGEERMVGEQLLYTIRAEFEVLDDPDISQYINDLGQSVLDVAGPQYFDYHFFVVKSDQFNAFAAPSGLIFFYTGLIRTMKTEDELLSVLAHEIGHAVSRHIAHRMDKQGKVSAATMLLGLASLALGNPALSQGLLTGSLAAGQAIGLSFSRQDEEQADRLSFGWMRDMHRNPKAMEGMLKTMRRITRYRTNKLPPYLLTHPNPEARLNYVESLVEVDPDQNQPGYYKKTDNFAFLRFKYRVLSQSLDPEELRIECANIISSGRDREQVIMAHYGLALLEAMDTNFADALGELDLVRKRYPNRDILNVDMAAIYLKAGRFDQAATLLHSAYKRDPTNMYAAFLLAQTVEKQGNSAEAERLYNEIAKAMPEYSKLYYELGRLKANQGRQGISNFYLAKYYLYEGRIKYAKQYLRRAVKDSTVPPKMQNEAQAILDRLKKIEEEMS